MNQITLKYMKGYGDQSITVEITGEDPVDVGADFEKLISKTDMLEWARPYKRKAPIDE